MTRSDKTVGLLTASVLFGIISYMFTLVISPHYGWLLHRWAITFTVAVLCLAMAAISSGRRLRLGTLLIAIMLAWSAIYPLRRIIVYGGWWDA